MPTDRDWVLDVVTGYNTDIDTCTITKGSTNKISAGHSLELHRAQTAERRAQNAERREQSAERRAQGAERRGHTRRCNDKRTDRSPRCVLRPAKTGFDWHRWRTGAVTTLARPGSRSQTCVARSTCKAKRSHRVSAHKEAAQVRTARTLPWRKRIVHEDNEVARRSPAPALRQQSESDGSRYQLPQVKWNEAKQGLTLQNDMLACIDDEVPGQKKSTSGQC